ncbi:MAG: type II secretion system protein [Patescibacteria group bacterium]
MQRGFSLFEVLIVIGILGVVALFTVGIDTRSISRSTASAESTVLLQMLIHARSRAMNNEYQMPHGVYVDANNFVLFRGNSYDPLAAGNEPTPRSTQVSISIPPAVPFEVVFTQLSGTTSAQTVKLASGVDSVDIDIKETGAIAW